jgi:hypothetical protein
MTPVWAITLTSAHMNYPSLIPHIIENLYAGILAAQTTAAESPG